MSVFIKWDWKRKWRVTVSVGTALVWLRGPSVLMKPDQLAVERGLPIIHALHVAKRGSETQLKTQKVQMWDPVKHITVSDSCCTLTNWHLMIPNWSKVNVKARCPSSAGRRSASEKDGGALKQYLHKDVFQSAEWADPHIQHSTRAVRICLTKQGWMASNSPNKTSSSLTDDEDFSNLRGAAAFRLERADHRWGLRRDASRRRHEALP